ncbi:hypothetical protein BD410DRAFT_23825 [Rickenella mellea]|uniref:Uncharacterized protein n=1 Tax=Rickenella mellea TaxID=50990 RepID=A0A4R5XEB7_9AGAM|nr:hypothetical protein BD410DRAFT_23825 [Rickenella mellea]
MFSVRPPSPVPPRAPSPQLTTTPLPPPPHLRRHGQPAQSRSKTHSSAALDMPELAGLISPHLAQKFPDRLHSPRNRGSPAVYNHDHIFSDRRSEESSSSSSSSTSPTSRKSNRTSSHASSLSVSSVSWTPSPKPSSRSRSPNATDYFPEYPPPVPPIPQSAYDEGGKRAAIRERTRPMHIHIPGRPRDLPSPVSLISASPNTRPDHITTTTRSPKVDHASRLTTTKGSTHNVLRHAASLPDVNEKEISHTHTREGSTGRRLTRVKRHT